MSKEKLIGEIIGDMFGDKQELKAKPNRGKCELNKRKEEIEKHLGRMQHKKSEAAFAAERERQINELKKRETEDFYCHEHDDKEMSKCDVQCPFCERV